MKINWEKISKISLIVAIIIAISMVFTLLYASGYAFMWGQLPF